MNEAPADSVHGDHVGVGHIVPLRLLILVLGVLLTLTVVTVAVTWVDLGVLNLIVALGIAAVKASLVLLYFMHLRWDRPFNALVVIVALGMLALFIVLALLDSQQYQQDLIPGYAPQLQQ